MQARRPSTRQGLGHALLLGIGLTWVPVGCRTLPPTETWITALDLGLREPSGTFATFRAAFCTDQSALQYRCLSQDYLSELGIEGQFVFREFRDVLLEREPNLKHLLAKAVVDREERISNREALVFARAYRRTIRVSLVRVDFWEIRHASEALDGDYLPDAKGILQVEETPGGEAKLRVELPLAEAALGRQASALEIGSEWKIRGFEVLQVGAAP